MLPNKSKTPQSKPKKRASGSNARTAAPLNHYVKYTNTRGIITQSPPSQRRSCITVNKREFIGNLLTTTTDFHLLGLTTQNPGYDGNPACRNLFPWLSIIAPGYEKFRFTKLKFETRGTAAATTPGRIYVAWEYDYDDPVATNSVQLMANSTAVDAAPWGASTVSVDTSLLNQDLPSRYVQRANRMSEPRTTFCGYLQIAAEGVPAGVSIGLFVDYTIELSIPTLESPSTTYIEGGDMVAGSGNYRTFDGFPVSAGSTIVRSGVAGVPVLIDPGTTSFNQALDLSATMAKSFEFVCKMNDTGKAPIDFLNTYADVCVFDSAGSKLGYATAAENRVTAMSPTTLNSGWSTQNNYFNALINFGLSHLLAIYPTAKYLAPVVVAGTNIFGTGQKKWTVNLA